MSSTSDPEVQVLRRAADLIEQVGWWDGGHASCSGHCPVTALAKCCEDLDDHKTVYDAALARLRVAIGRDAEDADASPVVDWNDAPGRTADEVVDALRKAAS